MGTRIGAGMKTMGVDDDDDDQVGAGGGRFDSSITVKDVFPDKEAKSAQYAPRGLTKLLKFT